MQLASYNLEDYLESSHYIETNHPLIQAKAGALTSHLNNSSEIIRTLFHYVRDEIAHSWDIQDRKVTITSTDVLMHGTGICYAKSNLLAALLRARQIPTGLCYQKLTLGDTPESGYCIHALNAVFLENKKQWIRLDARGNKKGINAEFYTDREQLAFPVREHLGEKDYPIIYYRPVPVTMQTLERNSDALVMYLHHLPQNL